MRWAHIQHSLAGGPRQKLLVIPNHWPIYILNPQRQKAPRQAPTLHVTKWTIRTLLLKPELFRLLLNNSQTAKPQAEFLCILSPASLCTKTQGLKKKNRCPPDRSQRQKKWLPAMPQWPSSPTLNRAELNRQHQVHGLDLQTYFKLHCCVFRGDSSATENVKSAKTPWSPLTLLTPEERNASSIWASTESYNSDLRKKKYSRWANLPEVICPPQYEHNTTSFEQLVPQIQLGGENM